MRRRLLYLPLLLGLLFCAAAPCAGQVAVALDPTEIRDASGTSTAAYYLSGALKTFTNGSSKAVTYKYGADGLLAHMLTPGSLSFDYTYNALNQLSTITNPQSVQVSFSYDNGGRPTRITRPGSYIDYAYNARNWLTSVHNRTTGGSTLYDATYDYNDSSLWDYTGNPLKRIENWGGSNYTTTLRYDYVSRLTEETKKDSSNNTVYTFGYTYDAVGNRLTRAKDGTTYTYSYDDNNKLTSASGGGLSASFSYDNNGNMTGVSGTMYGSKTLVYNDSNELTSLTSGGVTDLYCYNAGGQRYRARLAGTYGNYVYDGDRVLEQWNDSSTLTARYTTAGSSYFAPLLHEWFPSGTRSRFPLFDLTGTARELVDASANVTDTYTLDAFGVKMASDTGSTPNPYHYNAAWGYMTDPSGFQQLGARFCWPELGRFLQQDPIGDGMNWYAYVDNSPVTSVDPEGLRYALPWTPESTVYNIFTQDAWWEGIGLGWDSGYYDGYVKKMIPIFEIKDFVRDQMRGGATKYSSKWAARSYLHFTDKRFTRWGAKSTKMVPKLAGKISLGATLVQIFWDSVTYIRDCGYLLTSR